MLDGAVYETFGVHITVRDTKQADGYTKAKAIADALDAVTIRSLTFGGVTYAIYNFQRRSSILHVGAERKTGRHIFTLSGFLTVKETS